jgi:hypothetical protein
MSCEIVQRRLLSMTNPERLPANLRAHLARCAACREWHEQLVLLERHIPFVPIPNSNGKAKLMRRLLREQPSAPPGVSAAPLARADSPTLSSAHAATLLRSRPLILGVAAAVMLIALGWLGLQGWLQATGARPSTPAVDVLLASLVQRDLRLARAGTPGERLVILADVAEDLQGETNALVYAASLGELTALASLYDEVVRQGILKQAEAVPSDQRGRTLEPIALRMAQTASQVEQLIQQLPAEMVPPLHAIAAAARAAQRQLRALLPEGTA